MPISFYLMPQKSNKIFKISERRVTGGLFAVFVGLFLFGPLLAHAAVPVFDVGLNEWFRTKELVQDPAQQARARTYLKEANQEILRALETGGVKNGEPLYITNTQTYLQKTREQAAAQYLKNLSNGHIADLLKAQAALPPATPKFLSAEDRAKFFTGDASALGWKDLRDAFDIANNESFQFLAEQSRLEAAVNNAYIANQITAQQGGGFFPLYDKGCDDPYGLSEKCPIRKPAGAVAGIFQTTLESDQRALEQTDEAKENADELSQPKAQAVTPLRIVTGGSAATTLPQQRAPSTGDIIRDPNTPRSTTDETIRTSSPETLCGVIKETPNVILNMVPNQQMRRIINEVPAGDFRGAVCGLSRGDLENIVRDIRDLFASEDDTTANTAASLSPIQAVDEAIAAETQYRAEKARAVLLLSATPESGTTGLIETLQQLIRITKNRIQTNTPELCVASDDLVSLINPSFTPQQQHITLRTRLEQELREAEAQSDRIATSTIVATPRNVPVSSAPAAPRISVYRMLLNNSFVREQNLRGVITEETTLQQILEQNIGDGPLLDALIAQTPLRELLVRFIPQQFIPIGDIPRSAFIVAMLQEIKGELAAGQTNGATAVRAVSGLREIDGNIIDSPAEAQTHVQNINGSLTKRARDLRACLP